METTEGINRTKKKQEQQEKEQQFFALMTIDEVAPGEQQPGADHFIESENSSIGVNRDRHWRDAAGWFSYKLVDKQKQAGILRITYFGGNNDRKFKILINDQLIAEESFHGLEGNKFFEKDYPIPNDIFKSNSENLIIKFEGLPGSRTAGAYGIRLMKEKNNKSN